MSAIKEMYPPFATMTAQPSMYPPFATMTLQPATIILIGRATNLAYDDATGSATWTISVRHSRNPEVIEHNLKAVHHRVLDQFNQMQDGQMIRVIADVPSQRSRPLVVTYLELLDNPMPPQEVAA